MSLLDVISRAVSGSAAAPVLVAPAPIAAPVARYTPAPAATIQKPAIPPDRVKAGWARAFGTPSPQPASDDKVKAGWAKAFGGVSGDRAAAAQSSKPVETDKVKAGWAKAFAAASSRPGATGDKVAAGWAKAFDRLEKNRND